MTQFINDILLINQEKKIYLGLIALIISQVVLCQTPIIEKPVSFGWRKSSTRQINTVIIHSAFNNTGGDIYDIDLVIKQFGVYKVSPHYIIGREGNIYRMVNEENVAFHAGKSILPNGASNVNECSIGIELVTSFTESPTNEQMQSLVNLVTDIGNRYKIKYILRHSDIAPERKTDPWNFDWAVFLEILKNSSNYHN